MVGLPADGRCRLFTHEKYLLPLILAVYHDAGVKRYFAPADNRVGSALFKKCMFHLLIVHLNFAAVNI